MKYKKQGFVVGSEQLLTPDETAVVQVAGAVQGSFFRSSHWYGYTSFFNIKTNTNFEFC